MCWTRAARANTSLLLQHIHNRSAPPGGGDCIYALVATLRLPPSQSRRTIKHPTLRDGTLSPLFAVPVLFITSTEVRFSLTDLRGKEERGSYRFTIFFLYLGLRNRIERQKTLCDLQAHHSENHRLRSESVSEKYSLNPSSPDSLHQKKKKINTQDSQHQNNHSTHLWKCLSDKLNPGRERVKSTASFII